MSYTPITPVSRGFTPFQLLMPNPDGSAVYMASVGHNGRALASFAPAKDGTFILDVYPSTEAGYDFARGYIRDYSSGSPVDVVELFKLSGPGPTHEVYTVALPAGYALDVEYTRDSSDGGGDDQVGIMVRFTEGALDFDQATTPPADWGCKLFEPGAFAPDGSTGFKAQTLTDDHGAQAQFMAPRAGTAVIQWRIDATKPTYQLLLERYNNGVAARATNNSGWQTIEVEVAYRELLDVFYYLDEYPAVPAAGNSAQFTIHMLPAAGASTTPAYLSAAAIVDLFASHPLLTGIFTTLELASRAALLLAATGALQTIKPISGQTALSLDASQGSPAAPPGLGAAMKVITDPEAPDVILDQYLVVWFYGSPEHCQIALQIDDEAEATVTGQWINQRCGPAIVRLDGAALPADGQTHRLRVKVWQDLNGRTSPVSLLEMTAKTHSQRTAMLPEYCGAALIRQSSPTLGDLTRVTWRHAGAVQISARFIAPKVLGYSPTAEKTVVLGYADADEREFYAEGIAFNLGHLTSAVRFGVAAIHGGQFGANTWAPPVTIVGQRTPEPPAEVVPLQGSTIASQIVPAVTGLLASPPADIAQIINATYERLLHRIKDVVSKGGRVTLQDFGTFAASWKGDSRSIVFQPSQGLRIGTKLGRVLSDDEAKTAEEA